MANAIKYSKNDQTIFVELRLVVESDSLVYSDLEEREALGYLPNYL
jgi:hypothetical protein